MKGLITDRSQVNTIRLTRLSNKGWDGMTTAERAEWTGNPLTASEGGYDSPVNLLPPKGEGLVFRDGSITAASDGVVVIGDASDFAQKVVTLSAETVTGSLLLCWYDGTTYESAGGDLTAAGAITVTLSAGVDAQLVLKVASGHYSKVMLSLGHSQDEYVPYTEILATEATKGAYNYSDMNRVERATAEIAEILGITLTTKTDWSKWDLPKKSDLNRYLNNIRVIRDACYDTSELPDDMNKLTYTTANSIEELLSRLRMKAETLIRCNEVYCGEV